MTLLHAPGRGAKRARTVPPAVQASRREALIEAVLDLIAEGGPQAASVRAIATRAGATPGLIRHHFANKEALIGAAFVTFMQRVLDAGVAGLPPGDVAARQRLAAFVRGALRPPAMSRRNLLLWTTFEQMTRHDPRMRVMHDDGHLTLRNRLAELIAKAYFVEGREATSQLVRRKAIACGAVIDGLWMEASLQRDAPPEELAGIGCDAIGAIIGLELSEPAGPDARADHNP